MNTLFWAFLLFISAKSYAADLVVSSATQVAAMPTSIPEYRTDSSGVQSASASTPDSSQGITLNFQNTDIDLVLKLFGEMTGQIFLKSDSVRGFLSLASPKKLTTSEALDVLRAALDLKGFALVPSGEHMMKVLTHAEVGQTNMDVGFGVDDIAGDGDDRLATQVVPLRYVSASELKNQLTPLLTKDGALIPDERTNSILVTDLSSNIKRLLKMIRGLDTRTPQVLIEVLILEVSLTDELKLGVEWSHQSTFSKDGKTYKVEGGQNFDISNVISEGLKYAVFRTDLNLKALVQALATQQNVNVLSTPHVVTLNNQPATIRVGEEIPVLTQTRNIQGGETIRSFDYKTVAIELEVTPRINADREVLMKVHPMVRKILGFNTELNAPILATREAQTTVLVQDGQTVVIGGLIKDDRSLSESKVPLLGDIPLVGNLFKQKNITKEKTELLVFITPRVIGDADQARVLSIRKESEVKGTSTPYKLAARQEYDLAKSFYQEGDCKQAVGHLEKSLALTTDKKLRKKSETLIQKCIARTPKF